MASLPPIKECFGIMDGGSETTLVFDDVGSFSVGDRIATDDSKIPFFIIDLLNGDPIDGPSVPTDGVADSTVGRYDIDAWRMFKRVHSPPKSTPIGCFGSCESWSLLPAIIQPLFPLFGSRFSKENLLVDVDSMHYRSTESDSETSLNPSLGGSTIESFVVFREFLSDHREDCPLTGNAWIALGEKFLPLCEHILAKTAFDVAAMLDPTGASFGRILFSKIPRTWVDLANSSNQSLTFDRDTDGVRVACTLLYLGRAYLCIGKLGASLKCLGRAHELFQSVGSMTELIETNNVIGAVYLKGKDHLKAFGFHKHAYDIARDSSLLLKADALFYLGETYQVAHEIGLAMSLYEQAIELLGERLGSRNVDLKLGLMLVCYSGLLCVYGHFVKGSARLEEGKKLFAMHGVQCTLMQL